MNDIEESNVNLQEENEVLRTELLQLQDEYKKYKEEVLYQLAEKENMFKRKAKTVEIQADRVIETLLRSMLTVADDMEQMMLSLQAEKSDHAVGLAFIYKKLLKELQSAGCEQMTTINERFNPEIHEAVSLEECDKDSGTIVSCVSNGYIFRNKLLRAAKVRVAQ